MNELFKEEFKKLSKDEIKKLVNGCARVDVLETDVNDTIKLTDTSYFIKYMDDAKYGYWTIQWRFKKVINQNMPFSTGMFENSIKITPFKLEFENIHSSFNPFINTNSRKQLEDYTFVYINKCCPHYIDAIKEETETFINMLTNNNTKKASR